jgi:CheY-like chemotaxis protein
MNRRGPIIIIEDDPDDQELFGEVFISLNFTNDVIYFSNGEEALKFLEATDTNPFIIFSDINMPKLNGLELREKLYQNENLRLRSIPYLIFSTTAEQKHVLEAYSKSIQGFFIKPNTFSGLQETISIIVAYWLKCVAPNYVK